MQQSENQLNNHIPYDTNTYKLDYYHRNKDRLNQLAKRRSILKRHPINKKILEYEPLFSSIALNARRGIINEILITTYGINLVYNASTYDDFVDAFNSVCMDDSKKLTMESMHELV